MSVNEEPRSAIQMAESRGLGRGLSALLGAQSTVSASRGAGTLPVSLLQPGPFQPRRQIHQQPLEELAASIKENGVIQPIVVRRLATATAEGARYEIVAGERRWQAAKLAGLTEIPTIVRELSDQEASAVALIENIQREELTPAEEARALQRLISEFSLTHERLAEIVGRSRAAVSNLIRLLDLPAAVLTLIDTKKLSMGHARALLGLDTDADRERCAGLILKRQLSVRQTEELVRTGRGGEGEAAANRRAELSVISEVLKTATVHVQRHQKSSGSSKLIIEAKDSETIDAIIEGIRKVVS
jgi:ParB family transcriptional regulator, chromosome partitioning protein